MPVVREGFFVSPFHFTIRPEVQGIRWEFGEQGVKTEREVVVSHRLPLSTRVNQDTYLYRYSLVTLRKSSVARIAAGEAGRRQKRPLIGWD